MNCATFRWLLLTVVAMLLVLCAIDTADIISIMRIPAVPLGLR